MTRRPERVADLVREILAKLIREQVRDPRVGFVTVTGVKVSPDLKHARVYVSKLGDADERAAAVEALNHAAPFLRRNLGGLARLKYTPQLVFEEDTSIERGFRIESLIRDIRQGQEAEIDDDRDDAEDGDRSD